jgi:hypothetical protein
VLAVAYNTRPHLLPEGPNSIKDYIAQRLRGTARRLTGRDRAQTRVARLVQRVLGLKLKGSVHPSQLPDSNRFDMGAESVAAKSLQRLPYSARHREGVAVHASGTGTCHPGVPDVESGGVEAHPSCAAQYPARRPREEVAVPSTPPGARTADDAVRRTESSLGREGLKDPSRMAPQEQARYYTGQIHEGRMSTLLTSTCGEVNATASMEAEVVQRLIYFEHLFFQLDPCVVLRLNARTELLSTCCLMHATNVLRRHEHWLTQCQCVRVYVCLHTMHPCAGTAMVSSRLRRRGLCWRSWRSI